MSPDLPKKITHKIEAICEQGCSRVNKILVKAKNGDNIEELADFSPAEIELIVNELTQIMSVYDGECSPDKN